MANRSDWNSAMPRVIKRLFTMGNYDNAHERGEVKRSLLDAHATAKRVRIKRLASRDGIIKSDTE